MDVVANWMVAYPHISFSEYRCSNNTNKWMTFVFIIYKPIKNQFHMTIIAKLWPMKFVMCSWYHSHGILHWNNISNYEGSLDILETSPTKQWKLWKKNKWPNSTNGSPNVIMPWALNSCRRCKYIMIWILSLTCWWKSSKCWCLWTMNKTLCG